MRFEFEPIKRAEGVREAKESLELLRAIYDHAPECDAKVRLSMLINLIDENLRAFLPNKEFFFDLAPVLERFLATTTHDDIEIILKEEDVVNLISGVDDFVLRYHSDKYVTLQELIYRYMREKEIDKPSDVWKPVGLGRRTFHKLLTQYNDRFSQAPRLALLQLSVGLRLNIDETNELLEHQFYRLTRSKSDLLFVFFAMRRKKQREKDFTLASKREIDTIRQKLCEEGIILPEVYE